MTPFATITLIFAACFAIYNFIFYKNKLIIYSLRTKNFTVTNEKKYYKAQLIGGLVTTIVLIILAAAYSNFSSYITYGLACILTIGVFNLTLKVICLIRGYAFIPRSL